jgi:membrane-associated phospholipid phosphatase
MTFESNFGQILFSFLYLMDSDSNCCPSLHVSLSSLACYGLYNSVSRFRSIFVIWPILIWISTLTTKQHYLIDVLGGILVGAISLLTVSCLLPINNRHKN